jgi:hypothetical protein
MCYFAWLPQHSMYVLFFLLLFPTLVFGQTFNAAYIEKENTWSARQTFNAGTAGDDPGPTWAGLATSYNANRFVVNSFPTAAQFPGVVVEAMTGAVDIPASADFGTHSAGVAGYGRSSAANVGAVGVYGQGSTHVAGTTAWGSNFVVSNEGLNATNLFGIEVDINHSDATAAASNVSGVSITGASDSQASGVFAAFIVNPAGIFEVPPIKWKNAYISQPGAATSGLSLFTQDSTGASPSQFVEIYGRDAGDAYHGILMQVQSTGEFDLRAADAGGIKIQSNLAADWLTFTTAGEVLVNALKTTGSAATKKVVCVDTGTGQLYASTSDTICAN